MASTVPSVKITKRFTTRGVTRDWSNRYHFDNGLPADGTKWTALCDAIVLAEKAMHTTAVTIVEAAGFDAGSEVSVFTKSYSTTGTCAPASAAGVPGDVAALTRYSTSARTTKNHPLYLFNYYHGSSVANTGPWDTLHATQKTAMETYANAWITGFSDGAVTHHRAGPQGDLATGVYVHPYLTHRDFPRG